MTGALFSIVCASITIAKGALGSAVRALRKRFGASSLSSPPWGIVSMKTVCFSAAASKGGRTAAAGYPSFRDSAAGLRSAEAYRPKKSVGVPFGPASWSARKPAARPSLRPRTTFLSAPSLGVSSRPALDRHRTASASSGGCGQRLRNRHRLRQKLRAKRREYLPVARVRNEENDAAPLLCRFFPPPPVRQSERASETAAPTAEKRSSSTIF